MRSKHSRTCPVSCGVSALQVHSSSWARMRLWETQLLIPWSAFPKEEGIGPLALVFVSGSIDGQWDSPLSKEQAQPPAPFIDLCCRTSEHTNPFIHCPFARFFLPSFPSFHHLLTRFSLSSAWPGAVALPLHFQVVVCPDPARIRRGHGVAFPSIQHPGSIS